uniref:Uncharacterized protein n=1 Tax=Trichobilharzia regenti TaxID=157069 RepID=A0AA85J3K4_TRIRE|nr:unnamed protein product [Trichobilharzia regenti]
MYIDNNIPFLSEQRKSNPTIDFVNFRSCCVTFIKHVPDNQGATSRRFVSIQITIHTTFNNESHFLCYLCSAYYSYMGERVSYHSDL